MLLPHSLLCHHPTKTLLLWLLPHSLDRHLRIRRVQQPLHPVSILAQYYGYSEKLRDPLHQHRLQSLLPLNIQQKPQLPLQMLINETHIQHLNKVLPPLFDQL